MLVQNWMNKNPVTIDVDDTMLDAVKIMKEKNIRHLPILKKGKLVGIVTDRDLKKASPSDATALSAHELLYLTANIKVGEIMTKDPVTVPVDYTVEEAAELLLSRKISGLPVVDKNGNVVGTITQTDIFKVLISLTGIGRRGIQFAFLLEVKPGSTKEVTEILRKYNGRITSILASYEHAPEGFRHIYIRTQDVDRKRLSELKKELRASAKLLYMIDHGENRREIYES